MNNLEQIKKYRRELQDKIRKLEGELDSLDIKEKDLLSERENAIAEGRAEGLAEGRAEGIAEGIAEGLAEGKTKGIEETKVDVAKFKSHEIIGFDYSKYNKLLDTLNRITQKINNVCTGAVVYENINIESTFCPDICSLGFVVREEELFEPPAIEIDKKSLDRLGWNPTLVHSTTNRMHSLLTHTINTDRIGSTLKSILESSVRMCDQNLNPSTDSDADQLAIAKKRLANIRKLRKICAWDMTYTSVMYRQWSTMVNRFDIAVI